MSEFNQCADLCNTHDLRVAEELYQKLLDEGKNPLGYMMNLQNDLQVRLENSLGRTKAPKNLKTKGDLYEFLLQQKVAIDDEWREMVEAVAGMSLPAKDRSAIWKKWKAKYDELRAQPIDGLSKEDRLELLFEGIDIVHFMLNVWIALGLSEKDIFVLYALKNAENIQRQENGY